MRLLQTDGFDCHDKLSAVLSFVPWAVATLNPLQKLRFIEKSLQGGYYGTFGVVVRCN